MAFRAGEDKASCEGCDKVMELKEAKVNHQGYYLCASCWLVTDEAARE